MLGPQRVDAKSLREVTQAPKTYDLAGYYRGLRQPSTFRFAAVRTWEKFDELVRRNMLRVGPVSRPGRPLSVTDVALEHVALVLRENSVEARLFPGGTTNFIGAADMLLVSNSGINLLVGRHFRHGQLDLDHDHKAMGIAVLQLGHSMLVNDIQYAYITTAYTMRFVNIRPSTTGAGLDLYISPAIRTVDSLFEALVSVCLETTIKTFQVVKPYSFDFDVEAVEEPNIEPLSSFEEGTAGRIKWWVASRVSRTSYQISLDRIEPGLGVRTGTVTVRTPLESLVVSVVLFVDTHKNRLRHEASVYEHLRKFSLTCVPEMVAFGRLFGTFHVLALRPFGRPIVPDDLQINPELATKMRRALFILHNTGIMHHNVRLHCFYKDGQTVRITNFGSARLYRRLPTVAREAEMQSLDKLIHQILI